VSGRTARYCTRPEGVIFVGGLTPDEERRMRFSFEVMSRSAEGQPDASYPIERSERFHQGIAICSAFPFWLVGRLA